MRLILFSIIILSLTSAFAQVEVKEYYDQDHTLLKAQYQATDSITQTPDGVYKEFYLNGKKKIIGAYDRGIPEGSWKYFFENGNPKMEGEVKKGVASGYWKYYFEGGNISSEGFLRNGEKDDEWAFYYEGGNLKSKGSYNDGIKKGIWNYYYESGALKAQALYQEGRGIYKEFYENGSLRMEGINVDGKSDSLWQIYYQDGKLEAEGFYREGVKDGPWTYYFPNGRISSQGQYEEGLTQGKWTYYHSNGELKAVGAEHHGQKEGYWKLFNKIGEVKGEVIFHMGDGEYREFYDNGRLKVKGFISSGQYDSTWYYYYEDGTLEGKADYRKDIGDYIGYYPSGNIQMEGQLEGDKKVGIWTLYKANGDISGYYRPVYEEESPVFRIVKDSQKEAGGYSKPDYIYSRKKLRYFQPVINEYIGLIIGTNPFTSALGWLPLTAEYYLQERMGFEFQFSLERSPFFVSNVMVEPDNVYHRGFSMHLRQKFYHQENKIGMLYFAHDLRYSWRRYLYNPIQSDLNRPSVTRNGIEYAIMVGNRLLRDVIEPGFTFDLHVGLGIGIPFYEVNYSNRAFDQTFQSLTDQQIMITPRIGLNIGYNFSLTDKPNSSR